MSSVKGSIEKGKKLLNRIETRNVEFILSEKLIKNLKQIIPQAFIYEIEWLKLKLNKSKLNKNKFYRNLYIKEYSSRIFELEERLK